MKTIALKYYWLLPILLLCGFYIFRAVDFPVHDFANYYFGGELFSKGKFDTSIYFPYHFNKVIASWGYQNIFVSYAPNTPFLAICFVPFSWLPLAVSKFAFNCLSALLLVSGLKKLADFYKIEAFILLFVPLVFFVPIKNGLLFGQGYFVLFFLMVECWLAYEKKQTWRMAIFLSLAILLKISPLLLVLVFLARKQFRELFCVAVSLAVLFACTLFFNTFDTWGFFLEKVLSKASNGEISEAFVANYQSVFMFLKTIFVKDFSDNPNPVFDNPLIFNVLLAVFKFTILAIGFFITRRANNALYVFSYWILAMLLLSPYGSTYGFILMIPVFFALVKSPLSNVKKITGGALLFFICNIPPHVFLSNPFPFSYLKLFALLLLFVLFLSWMYQYVEMKFVAVAMVLSGIATVWFKKIEVTRGRNLLEKSQMLVYDYRIENDSLTYFYWDENGENSKSIAFNNSKTEKVSLRDNQVYRSGRFYTMDQSNKRNVTVIDNSYAIFLSDNNRGIGFYTLRIVNFNTERNE